VLRTSLYFFLAHMSLGGTMLDADSPSGYRVPLWPTEVDIVAAPLHRPKAFTKDARVAAIQGLDIYTTAAMQAHLNAALRDPSPEVQRWALSLCLRRRLTTSSSPQINACLETAIRLWQNSDQTSIRTTALSVVSMHLDTDRATILFTALHERNDLLRAHAAMLLGETPLDDRRRDQARQLLATKLADTSSDVRRAAARSLGQLGIGPASLALVRLLNDTDLTVLRAAVQALGDLEDPRAASAIRRVVERSSSEQIARSAVLALAQLRDPAIDIDLLRYLDTPPAKLSRTTIVTAIGRRHAPTTALLRGLIDRLRDPELVDAVVRALRLLGDAASPALEAARTHGMEASLRLEVDRLLASRAVPLGTVPHGSSLLPRSGSANALDLPALDDRQGWYQALSNTTDSAILAASALAQAGPAWLSDATAEALMRSSEGSQVRNWLLATAVSPSALMNRPEQGFLWSVVIGIAADSRASAESRCAATLALRNAAHGRHEPRVRPELLTLAGSASHYIRGCTATALAIFSGPEVERTLAGLLADPQPRVRLVAALALATRPRRSSALRARLGLMAATDASDDVQAAARWVLARTQQALALRLVPGQTNFPGPLTFMTRLFATDRWNVVPLPHLSDPPQVQYAHIPNP